MSGEPISRPPDATTPSDSTPASALPPVARPVVTPVFDLAAGVPRGGAPVVARPVTAALPSSPLELNTLTRRQAALDLALVLLVCLGLPLAQGTVLALSGRQPTRADLALALSLPAKAVEAGTVCALAVYLGLRHRMSPRGFGLTIRALPAQLGWGVAALVAVYAYMAATVVAMVPFASQLQPDLEKRVEMFRLFEDGLDRPASVALLLVPVVIHEELLFRGLMLPLLRRASGSWLVAVLLASAVFGALHLMQGVFGALQIFGLSIVLSVFFIFSRSLLAVLVAHYVFDFVQMAVVGPLLRDYMPAT